MNVVVGNIKKSMIGFVFLVLFKSQSFYQLRSNKRTVRLFSFPNKRKNQSTPGLIQGTVSIFLIENQLIEGSSEE